MLFLDLLVDAR